MRTYVLTIIGDDQPGLVGTLAAAVADGGGSWEQSTMARLKGKFAGIVVVEIPDVANDDFVASLERIERDGLLHISAEAVGAADPSAADDPVELELIGPDQPGIVSEVTAALASHKVSIVEFESEVRDAPMGGGQLFEARLAVALPTDIEIAELRSTMEEVAAGLMVELTFG